jgi:hypothetical protein
VKKALRKEVEGRNEVEAMAGVVERLQMNR